MTAALKIAAHALFAGVFFFLLQHFGMGQDLENSLIWAAAGAAAAALLAWMQYRRGS